MFKFAKNEHEFNLILHFLDNKVKKLIQKKKMVKGKRWKKGQSSSSNPETKKYREIAKNNRVFSFGLPNKSNGQF